MVARCAARSRQSDLESAAKDNSPNCLGLARRLAPPTGSPRCGSATLASLGAFRPRFKQLVKKVGPEKAEAMLQTAEQGFKENYALLKKLSEM